MFATQWIKHAESTMLDHPNHPVPSGYKLREVARMCLDCKTKKVGKSYSKCYNCRKFPQEQPVPQWGDDSRPVVTFDSADTEVVDPTHYDPVIDEPIVTFTYTD
jgi:hypothetical protein